MNILAQEQMVEMDYVGIVAGSKTDKFEVFETLSSAAAATVQCYRRTLAFRISMTLGCVMQRLSDLPESPAAANKFDKIISLGCNCELTWNIRTHFGIERAYPLDWWITPYQALWKLLENGFQDLFNANNLEVSPDLLTVRDTYFNLLYHHDFKRGEDDRIIDDRIDRQLPLLKQKYDRLVARFFRDPQNKRVLFIRNRDGNIPHLDRDATPMDQKAFERLYDLLETLFPDSEITLLIANCPRFPSVRRRQGCIVWDETANYDDAQYFAGSPRGWKEMFLRNHIFHEDTGALNSVASY